MELVLLLSFNWLFALHAYGLIQMSNAHVFDLVFNLHFMADLWLVCEELKN